MKKRNGALALLVCGTIVMSGTMVAAAAGPAGPAGDAPVPVIVSAGTGSGGAPLAAVTVTGSSLQCAYGRVAMGPDGTVGYVLPLLGPAVLRAAAPPLTTVNWTVVGADAVAGRGEGGPASAFAVCTRAQ